MQLPDSLVGLIYDTALNPERWVELLVSIASHIDLLDSESSEQQLALLLTHFENSLTIGERLDSADTQQVIQQKILDQFPIPCVLVAESGEIQQISKRTYIAPVLAANNFASVDFPETGRPENMCKVGCFN